MNKSTLSPFAFGWLAAIGVVSLYLIGGSIITLIAADSFSTTTGDVDISSRNLFLSAAVGQILFLLLPTLFLSRIHPLGVIESLRLRPPRLSHILLTLLGIVACYMISIAWLTAQELYMIPEGLRPLYDRMKEEAAWLTEKMIVGDDIFLLLLALLGVAVIPAISEELLFRGMIQRSFEDRLRPFMAMFLAGLIFGILHAQPTNFIPLFGLGMFLGFIAWVSGSIWPGIIGHMVFNGTQVLLVNLAPQSLLEPEGAATPEDFAQMIPLAIVGIGVLVSVIITMIKGRERAASLPSPPP